MATNTASFKQESEPTKVEREKNNLKKGIFKQDFRK